MEIFRQQFVDAYLVLRKNGRDIISLLRILLSSGFPEISKKSISFLDGTLALSKTEREAIELINKAIDYVMKK